MAQCASTLHLLCIMALFLSFSQRKINAIFFLWMITLSSAANNNYYYYDYYYYYYYYYYRHQPTLAIWVGFRFSICNRRAHCEIVMVCVKRLMRGIMFGVLIMFPPTAGVSSEMMGGRRPADLQRFDQCWKAAPWAAKARFDGVNGEKRTLLSTVDREFPKPDVYTFLACSKF